MTDREVMQQALEALEAGLSISPGSVLHDRFRARLAEPEPELKAWVHPTQGHMQRRTETMPPEVVASYERGGWTPLYTAPPTRRPLTDNQLDDIAVAARRGNLYDLRIAIERAYGITGGNDE